MMTDADRTPVFPRGKMLPIQLNVPNKRGKKCRVKISTTYYRAGTHCPHFHLFFSSIEKKKEQDSAAAGKVNKVSLVRLVGHNLQNR